MKKNNSVFIFHRVTFYVAFVFHWQWQDMLGNISVVDIFSVLYFYSYFRVAKIFKEVLPLDAIQLACLLALELKLTNF